MNLIEVKERIHKLTLELFQLVILSRALILLLLYFTIKFIVLSVS